MLVCAHTHTHTPCTHAHTHTHTHTHTDICSLPTSFPQQITSFSVIEVLKPRVGEACPARVRADVTLTLNVQPSVRMEWEALRKHDVCFLITCRPSSSIGSSLDYGSHFVPQVRTVLDTVPMSVLDVSCVCPPYRWVWSM